MITEAGAGSDLDGVLAAVEAALGARLTAVAPLEGGHSGVTLTAVAGGRRIVIKAAAPGRPAVGRHDVLRQVRGMQVASRAIPVPEILAVSEPGEHPWFVMAFVEGIAAEPALDEHESGDDVLLVRSRFSTAASLLARLHAVDVEPLLATGEPVSSPSDQLDTWARTLAAAGAEFRTEGEAALARLRERVPPAVGPVLVHGDYRLGNLLFEGEHAAGVIDWEIWSVGDPRVDLAWFLTFCDPSQFPGTGRLGRRIPPVAEVVPDYAWAAGESVDDLAWFLAMAAFKMGVIMAHNLERHRTGRHVDPFQETLPPTIHHLLTVAADPERRA